MRPLLATSLMCALCNSVVHADLRYTTRVEVRRTAAAAAQSVPENLEAALRALMPPREMRVFLTADAMRIEQVVGATATVALIRPDGWFALYPDSRTYARSALPDDGAAAGQSPPPVVRRTGAFATILGVRAERILVAMTLTLPITPPAGFPTAMTLEGELWLTDAHLSAGGGLRKLLGPATGIPGGIEGMVLRQVLRNAQLGYEVETQVLELVEGPLDAALFEIPAGYRPVEQRLMPEPPGGRR